jgi:hypothetical protein
MALFHEGLDLLANFSRVRLRAVQNRASHEHAEPRNSETKHGRGFACVDPTHGVSFDYTN